MLVPEVGLQVRLRGIRRPDWLILVRYCLRILGFRRTNFLIWKVQAHSVVVRSCAFIDIVLQSEAHALVFPADLVVRPCDELVKLLLSRKVLGFIRWNTKLCG